LNTGTSGNTLLQRQHLSSGVERLEEATRGRGLPHDPFLCNEHGASSSICRCASFGRHITFPGPEPLSGSGKSIACGRGWSAPSTTRRVLRP